MQTLPVTLKMVVKAWFKRNAESKVVREDSILLKSLKKGDIQRIFCFPLSVLFGSVVLFAPGSVSSNSSSPRAAFHFAASSAKNDTALVSTDIKRRPVSFSSNMLQICFNMLEPCFNVSNVVNIHVFQTYFDMLRYSEWNSILLYSWGTMVL